MGAHRQIQSAWLEYHQDGISLLELLVCLMIAGTLLMMALPAFSSMRQQYLGTTVLNQLSGAIQFTRHAAVTHNSRVTLCPSLDQATCAGRNQWHHGSIVFLDLDGDGRRNELEPLLRAFPPLEPGARIYWRSFRNQTYLQMTSTGRTSWQNGTFLYCPASADPSMAKALVINAQGRIRVNHRRDAAGNLLDGQGQRLTCPDLI